jgi:hypothetical protein
MTTPTFDFRAILATLAEHQVEFIVVKAASADVRGHNKMCCQGRMHAVPDIEEDQRGTPTQPAAVVYEARGSWGEADLSEFLGLSDVAIGRAVFRKNEITFDWMSDEKRPVQHTRLSSTDGVRFEGYTEYASGYGNDRAWVDAVLYSNSLGHILLGDGTWQREGRNESFIIQFRSGKPVEAE